MYSSLTKASSVSGTLNKLKQAASTVVSKIKQAAKTVIEVIDNYLVKPFKSKDNLKQFIKDIKERIKDILFLRKRKNDQQAATQDKSKFNTWLNKFGIDSDKIKEVLKKQSFNLMLFGNFNPNRMLYQGLYETQLKEPSKYDIIRRDIQIWTRIKIQ